MYFDELDLNDNVLDALYDMRFDTCTPVQEKCIPEILEGHDVLGVAQTGTGKTAAYLLPVLSKLDDGGYPKDAINCVIMSPTRELAQQIDQAMQGFGYYLQDVSSVAVYGGNDGNRYDQELKSLRMGADVVIATPGRLITHISLGNVDLSKVSFFILDEADRMLDMGFEEPIREIAGRTHAERQSLLFSATFPDAIRELARALLKTPEEVTIDGDAEAPAIQQLFFEAESAHRQKALAGLLLKYTPESAVVFCNTRKDVDEVANSLRQFGFSALALHGDMEQRDRDEVLLQFSNRSCNVLVASDVAARGLDVEDLAVVVNYELPTDIDTYQHRVGRTGRAGRSGLALSLVTGRERNRAEALEAAQGNPLNWQKTPLATARPAQLPQAAMTTLRIDGGKTDKLRAGDILGALTGDAGLSGKAIGKIDIFPPRSYVAVAQEQAGKAVARLEAGKIKGKRFRVRKM